MTTPTEADLKRAMEWWLHHKHWFAVGSMPILRDSVATLLVSEREPLEKAIQDIHALVARGDHGCWKLNAQCAIDSIADMKRQAKKVESLEEQLAGANGRAEKHFLECERLEKRIQELESNGHQACAAAAKKIVGLEEENARFKRIFGFRKEE